MDWTSQLPGIQGERVGAYSISVSVPESEVKGSDPGTALGHCLRRPVKQYLEQISAENDFNQICFISQDITEGVSTSGLRPDTLNFADSYILNEIPDSV
jgi:hypothetical protein